MEGKVVGATFSGTAEKPCVLLRVRGSDGKLRDTRLWLDSEPPAAHPEWDSARVKTKRIMEGLGYRAFGATSVKSPAERFVRAPGTENVAVEFDIVPSPDGRYENIRGLRIVSELPVPSFDPMDELPF